MKDLSLEVLLIHNIGQNIFDIPGKPTSTDSLMKEMSVESVSNLFYALHKPSPYSRTNYVDHISEEGFSRVNGLFTWRRLQRWKNFPVGLE
jgi:hypothetical protein